MQRDFVAALGLLVAGLIVVAPERARGGPEPQLPAACWTRGPVACDPRTDEGCSGAAHCTFRDDTAALELACVSGGSLPVGAACSARTAARCGEGKVCWSEVCRSVCCDDGACTTAGERCVAFERRMGTLGTCAPPTQCAAAGGACVGGADCCSGDCHGNHCH